MDTLDTLDDILNEFKDIYTKALAESDEYFHNKAECERLGIVVLAAHVWAVVLDEPACNNAIGFTPDRKYCLKGVRGHLCGTSFFSRKDAEMVAADWASKAPDSLKNVRVIHKDDLAATRRADAQASLDMVNDRIAQRSNRTLPA